MKVSFQTNKRKHLSECNDFVFICASGLQFPDVLLHIRSVAIYKTFPFKRLRLTIVNSINQYSQRKLIFHINRSCNFERTSIQIISFEFVFRLPEIYGREVIHNNFSVESFTFTTTFTKKKLLMFMAKLYYVQNRFLIFLIFIIDYYICDKYTLIIRSVDFSMLTLSVYS